MNQHARRTSSPSSPSPRRVGRHRSGRAALCAAAASVGCAWSADQARAVPLTLDNTGNYTQSFDSIGSGLPSGFSVYTGATAATIGTAAVFNATPALAATTTGQFANFASSDGFTSVTNANGFTTSASTAQQNADTDRVIGLRQTGAFGDPGGSIDLQLTNTIGFSAFTLGFNLETPDNQTRSTTYTIQYGLGTSPTSFTTLGTYVSGSSFNATPETFGPTLLSGIDNQSSAVTFRIVALAASTGGGSRDLVALDDLNLSYTVSSTPKANGNLTYDPTNANGGLSSPNFTTTSTVTDFRDAGLGSDVAYTNGATVNFTDAGVGINPNIFVDPAGVTPTVVSVNNSTGTFSFSGGAIGGTGQLIKSNAGSLVLANANTYSGGTTITGGTVSVSADNNLGTGNVSLGGGTLLTTAGFTSAKQVAVTTTGTVSVNDGNTVEFTGSLAGTTSSALTKAGGGTLVFDFANDGTIATGNKSIGALNVTAGTLTLQNSSPTTSTFLNIGAPASPSTVTGTLNLGNGNPLLAEPVAGSTFNGTGQINVAANTALYTFATGTATINTSIGVSTSAAASSVLGAGSGAFNGGSGRLLVVNGPIIDAASGVSGGVTFGGTPGTAVVLTGKVVLTGNDTYSGGTTITAGTVVANNSSGSLGSATVTVTAFNASAGGILAGSGKVLAPVTLAAGGTFTGGSGATASDAIGSLALSGGLTLSGAGGYAAKIDGKSASAAFNTGGSNLSNGTVSGSDRLILSDLSNSGGTLTVSPVLLNGGSFVIGSTYSFVLADVTDSASAFDGLISGNTITVAQGNNTNYQLDTAPDGAGGEYLLLDFTAATPEPTSLLLAGLAAAPLALGRRRKAGRRHD